MKEKINPEQCQVVSSLNTLLGKWKPIILQHLLAEGTLRFNELKKRIPDITQRMLTLHLRELEAQDLIKRVVYPQVPPKVEYSLTEYGKTIEPLMNTLHDWGKNHLQHIENLKKLDKLD
ncbi:winged helix-turn-helix transcriptional regulator [Planococcus shenhongbingii]|uniref:Winged helix-turn-helix transcriptional regulator n=1 Tax=Planococcus shenhongbingii TaxID=3058398 RepID=A0ABT8NBP4_9BACL|nr:MULTISPECIES: winged helix-turn-helix transcriptional regulator [unclassified Planococcus (in: firmicutes)]MDN7245296.1 winged helix-turn-helix transcriptional regulator [Planococcus sp. N017]WKA58402.1 winged helix-turn-helix transcriptional regulator [Planococcus sp. N016]